MIGNRLSTDTIMMIEINGAVLPAQMTMFVALLLQILNKMTKAVGCKIVSGRMITTATRIIGHDRNDKRTSNPRQRRPVTVKGKERKQEQYKTKPMAEIGVSFKAGA